MWLSTIGRCALLLLIGSLLLGPAGAEDDTSEVEAHRRRGLEALAAGDSVRARHFLLRALALEPASVSVMGDLLRLDAEHPDRQALWLRHAAAIGCDARGTFKPPRGWPRVAREDLAAATKLLRLRAQALKSLATAASRLRGAKHASALRYLRDLAGELADGSPALKTIAAKAFDKATPRCAPDPTVVCEALDRLMHEALKSERPGLALHAARILRGLHQQEKQDKAAVPSPDDGMARVLGVLREARRRLRATEAPELTVGDLDAVVGSERAAWSASHASWDAPGVARSPTGMYRVETVCGLATLLVATRDVEYQHRRLARWFGEDPFEGRPGLVRICPSYRELESEGQPFWWAPGFQSGDLTGLLARFPSRHGLARMLTHELTHRFDGILYPGLPTWLLEGRAVFTEVGTIHPHSAEVDERMFSGGRIWKASTQGYGRYASLVKLLQGTVSDYRDYYDAGYCLWTFLRRYRGFEPPLNGPLPFAPCLDEYVRSFARGPPTDAAAHFAATFADGKDGRPSDLKEFAKLFGRFLNEGARTEHPPWRKVWDREYGAARRAAGKVKTVAIHDVATCPRTRQRYDPVPYGEEQAYAAGHLLEAEGDGATAIEAFEWAFAVDEPRAARYARVAALHSSEGNATAAWVRALDAHGVEPTRYPRPGGIPSGLLHATWRAAAGVAGRLSALATAARDAGRDELARALDADHDALARRLALPLGAFPSDSLGEATSVASSVPGCHPFQSELAGELISERWSRLDSQRSRRWNRPTPFELELGRSKRGKAVTGTLRDAGVRRVFVRANRFHAGTYTFRTRVRFLSAYADLRIVVGRTRRDRGVVLFLRGGDLDFAIGQREEFVELKTVRASLSDLRSFDWEVSPLGRTVRLRSPRDSFSVVIHVSGPYVRVLVDDQEMFSHRRSTEAPIEGTVGFGLYCGLAAFLEPETRHHRVRGPARVCACGAFDESLRFDRPLPGPAVWYVGRRFSDLPLNPGGTLLLWYGADTPALHRSPERVYEHIADARNRVAPEGLPVAIRVAFPAPDPGGPPFPDAAALELPPESVHVHAGAPSLRQLAHADLESHARFLEKMHPKERAHDLAVDFALGRPAWFMIDDLGVVRAYGRDGGLRRAATLAHRLSGW